MKISSAIFQLGVPNVKKQATVEKVELTPVQQFEQSRHELKDIAQQVVAQMEKARTDMGEDDPKAQRLIEKFKSGKKLTAEELNYVRKHAPGMRDVIDRVMREREVIEMSMRQAPSKTEVQMVAYRASRQIEKDTDAGMKELRAKHLTDAKYEYEQTEEYKVKPNSPLERDAQPARVAVKNGSRPYMSVAVASYEKANMLDVKRRIEREV